MELFTEENRNIRYGIKVSVRSLVEFVLRSGDIDDRFGGPSVSAMQEGSRMHRLIQGKQGGEYRAEVPLRYDYVTEKYVLRIEGRADGIISRHVYEYRFAVAVEAESFGAASLAPVGFDAPDDTYCLAAYRSVDITVGAAARAAVGVGLEEVARLDVGRRFRWRCLCRFGAP